MREFSPSLRDHLAGTVTTLCSCWIVRRRDGQALGFTDHDASLEIEGITCQAMSGFEPTEAVSELGLSVDNQEIEGALASEAITERDLQAGLYDGAQVEVWMVNWAIPQDRHLMRIALLGEVAREDNLFKAELQGQTVLLNQNQGRSYSRDCDAVLGDGRCGVDLTNPAMWASGTVLQVVDRLTIRCSGLDGFAAGWFAFGQLAWETGENSGLGVEISASQGHRGDELTLWKAMPFAPQVGDTFKVTAGCDKSFATCKAKFANPENFRGFPHMPGSDFAHGYALADANHDGGPLIL